MKTLIILDKIGTVGLQYAIVDTDISKYNGLVLNNDSKLEKECVDFLTNGVKENKIEFFDTMSYFKSWDKTCLITYYQPVSLKELISQLNNI